MNSPAFSGPVIIFNRLEGWNRAGRGGWWRILEDDMVVRGNGGAVVTSMMGKYKKFTVN